MDMKKCFFLLMVTVFLFACNKPKTQDDYITPVKSEYENVIVPLQGNTKSLDGAHGIKFKVGHPATNCPGCVTIGGILQHVDCMGSGNDCVLSANVNVSSSSTKSTVYHAITIDEYDLTTEDFFQMPARSLFVDDGSENEMWLNIPEQLAVRDSVTGQFMFEGLFYSDYPAYEND